MGLTLLEAVAGAGRAGQDLPGALSHLVQAQLGTDLWGNRKIGKEWGVRKFVQMEL